MGSQTMKAEGNLLYTTVGNIVWLRQGCRASKGEIHSGPTQPEHLLRCCYNLQLAESNLWQEVLWCLTTGLDFWKSVIKMISNGRWRLAWVLPRCTLKNQRIHIDIESSSKIEVFKQNQSDKEHGNSYCKEQLSSVFNIAVREKKKEGNVKKEKTEAQVRVSKIQKRN